MSEYGNIPPHIAAWLTTDGGTAEAIRIIDRAVFTNPGVMSSDAVRAEIEKAYADSLRQPTRSLAEILDRIEARMSGIGMGRPEMRELLTIARELAETLRPFAELNQPGDDCAAHPGRMKFRKIRERDLAQAWHILQTGERWRPDEKPETQTAP